MRAQSTSWFPGTHSTRVDPFVMGWTTLSNDDGQTWSAIRVIDGGPSAYSSLSMLPDATMGLLYEHGERSPYERITFVRFTLDDLTSKPF